MNVIRAQMKGTPQSPLATCGRSKKSDLSRALPTTWHLTPSFSQNCEEGTSGSPQPWCRVAAAPLARGRSWGLVLPPVRVGPRRSPCSGAPSAHVHVLAT